MLVNAIILAAGVGKRMYKATTKQFIEVDGKPIIYYTLNKFVNHPLIDSITLVTHQDEIDIIKTMIKHLFYAKEVVEDKDSFYISSQNGLSQNSSSQTSLLQKKKITCVIGGKERYNSVYNGLKSVGEEITHVLIHDGARPLIKDIHITEVINKFNESNAVIVGIEETNTIKRVSSEGYIEETIPRESLFVVQTPQGFLKETIVEAYEKGMKEPQGITDDSMMVELFSSEKVRVVYGDSSNIKITTSSDLTTFESFLKKDSK